MAVPDDQALMLPLMTKEARQYVSRIEKKIVLIDGSQLASLMFDFGIGVNVISTYEVKRVDTDFFSEE